MDIDEPAPINAALRMLSMSVNELWIDYFGLGGNYLVTKLSAFLDHGAPIDSHNYDVLVHALNERFCARSYGFPLLYADEFLGQL